jgi:homoserine kinase
VSLLATATKLEGHPDNAAAALLGGFVVCVGAHAARFDVPSGLESILVVPHKHVRTAKARAALPAQVPLADAVHNVGHASMLVLGLLRGDWDLVSAGLHDRLHQPRRASLYPQSMALVRRAQELGALGATISGAGPSVLIWTHYEATGAVMARLKPATAGWARLMHVPFEPQGAFVREL